MDFVKSTYINTRLFLLSHNVRASAIVVEKRKIPDNFNFLSYYTHSENCVPSLSEFYFSLPFFGLVGEFGTYALRGSTVALSTALLLGAERSLIFVGLYGYNGILTAIALAPITLKKGKQIQVSFLIGYCLSLGN